MAVEGRGRRTPRPPYDAAGLEEAALAYAGRYATSRAKLRAYLGRKLRERGWAGEGEPPVEALAERLASLGYVDDAGFAAARAASLSRRGYGPRRIGEALRAAGIEEEDSAEARAAAQQGAWTAALRFAERRRIGPFADRQADRPGREKAVAAMLRAGHALDLARRLAEAKPGEIPDPDGR